MKQELDIVTFGDQLLITKDLDPIYVMLWEAEFSKNHLRKWLLAYWCFYHCGTSSWIADHEDYWEAMMTAAKSKEYPRGTERRHFRGEQAVKAIQSLASEGKSPQILVYQMCSPNQDINLQDTFKRVKRLRGFGNWIAFKVADMLERLELSQVVVEPSDVFSIYEEPRKGAIEAHRRYAEGPDKEENPLDWTYTYLEEQLGHHEAPPGNARTINIQEIETILCKWKSHLNGKYNVGKDTKELPHHLKMFNTRSTQQLKASLKKANLL